jgi:hypothetical protein
MAGGSTALERMEEKAELMFGGAKPFGGGMVDKSMLMTEDSNRWTVSVEQAQYEIIVKLGHDLLMMWDNMVEPRHRPVKDQNDQWHEEYYTVDNFQPLLELIYQVRTGQNTLADHTRQQHLRQAEVTNQFQPALGEPPNLAAKLGKFVGGKGE